MDELVERLSNGTHPVEVSLRPAKSVEGFKACLERGYVHLLFTGTRGGTELGVRIDAAASNLGGADFAAATGRVTVVGDLVLNYEKVRCHADVELPSLAGTGRLEPLGAA
jgi:hypothetical protein